MAQRDDAPLRVKRILEDGSIVFDLGVGDIPIGGLSGTGSRSGKRA